MATSIYSPASDLSPLTWQLVGGGTHASAMLTDDADAKYIFRAYNSTSSDVWAGVFNTPVPRGASVTLVQSIARGRSTNLSAVFQEADTDFTMKIGGVLYPSIGFGEETWQSLVYITQTRAWPTNPATGVAWLYGDFANLQGFGIDKVVSNNVIGQIRITQAYLQVDYTFLPLTAKEIEDFWRLHRLVRRREIDERSTDAQISAKWIWYDELRNRANANGQDMKPPRGLTDRDYDAGLFRAKRRFR